MLLHAAMQGVTVSVGYEGILRRLRLEVTAIKFSLVSVKNATTPLNEGRREYLPDVLKNVSFGFMDMFWLAEAELMALLAM